MNLKLKEINEIISWCDQMLDIVQKNGYIKSNHAYYRTLTLSDSRYDELMDEIGTVIVKYQMMNEGGKERKEIYL